jgi:hypothetical protein
MCVWYEYKEKLKLVRQQYAPAPEAPGHVIYRHFGPINRVFFS